MNNFSISIQMMTYFYFAMILVNFYVYGDSKRNWGKTFKERPAYKTSFITRWFKYGRYVIYVLIVGQISYSGFYKPNFSLASSGFLDLASVIISLLANGLLWKSLKDLGSNFSPCENGRLPKVRVTTWPFRYLRHPIYVANTLLVVAVALVFQTPIIFLTLASLLIFYTFSIFDEEVAWSQTTRNEEP